MLQAADSRQADDGGGRVRAALHVTSARGLLAAAEVRSVLVVVGDERLKEPVQMVLVQDDDVVEQLLADGADKALGRSVAVTSGEKMASRSKTMKLNQSPECRLSDPGPRVECLTREQICHRTHRRPARARPGSRCRRAEGASSWAVRLEKQVCA